MSIPLPIEFNGTPVKGRDGNSYTPMQVLSSDNLEVRHLLGREPSLVYPVFTTKGITWAIIEKDTERIIMRFSTTGFNVIIKAE